MPAVLDVPTNALEAAFTRYAYRKAGLTDEVAASGPPDDYPGWLAEMFPTYTTAPLAERHRQFWSWIWAITRGTRPKPFIGLWPRGGAKSTSAELACVALAARRSRTYALYVSGKQAQADDHVMNVAGMLESGTVEQHYPKLSARKVGKYGSSLGWRRNRVRTASGFTIDAVGLDVLVRGVKLDEARPDLLIFDDVDDTEDSQTTIQKKIRLITQKILPAGSNDVATLFIQNLVHHESIAARLAGLASEEADFLTDRIVSGPYPALLHFKAERRPDGRWEIDGVPTWAGQDLETCRLNVSDWGIKAFRSEAQHEKIPPVGQAFPEWEPSVHVVDDPTISPEWAKARAVDYGYAAPFCCLWGAKRPDGAIVIYREAYGPGLTASQQADLVLQLSGDESYRYSMGDPSMWASQREGKRFKSVADQYKAAGVRLKEASNNRLSGWERLHAYLDWAERKPPLLTVSRACTNLIRTLPILVRDPNKPEDVDTETEDHAADALRYLLMAFTRPNFGAALGAAMTKPAPPVLPNGRVPVSEDVSFRTLLERVGVET